MSQFNYMKVLKEIEYINSQFQNLRTYIIPDPITERNDTFYYVMFPADGSLADQPLVGKLWFVKPYPEYPPVMHLFTLTERYNVDVFNYSAQMNLPSSSMCFDILERKGDSPSGIWEKSFNLTSVFASLLQVIVSIKVRQKYSDHEIVEYVSMVKMVKQHADVDKVWLKYKKYFEKCPKIQKTEAKQIQTLDRLVFSSGKIPISFTQGRRTYSSSPFTLGTASFSVSFDLADFKKLKHTEHKYNYVVSFVLSNRTNDLTGRFDDTILIRNGITGTAAKKLKYQDTKWFYHGKPLVDFNRVVVTVANKQITMVVKDESNDSNIIHGDTVLSYLTESEIGRVSPTEVFYLNLYIETKNTIPGDFYADEKLFVRIHTHNSFGFVHPTDRFLQVPKAKPKLATAAVAVAATEKIEIPQTPLDLSITSLFIDRALFKDSKIILNPASFKLLESLIGSYEKKNCNFKQENQLVGPSRVELDRNGVAYLKILLRNYRVSNSDLFKLEENSAKTQPMTVKTQKNQPAFESKVKESAQSPAQFWSNFRGVLNPQNKAKDSIIIPVNEESNDTGYDSESLAASLADLVFTETLKYSNEYLDSVLYVGVDLSQASKLIYNHVLSLDNKEFLLSKFENIIDPGHVTLGYYKDFVDRYAFHEFLQEFDENELVELHITGFVYDYKALALLVDGAMARKSVKYYPEHKNLHITVGLNGKTSAVYSNQMIEDYKYFSSNEKLQPKNFSIKCRTLAEPVVLLGRVKFFKVSKAFVRNRK